MAILTSGFGELLRHYRVAAGLTQEELAERAGVSTRGISDLERGARGWPRKDTLHLLLQALDLAPADRTALTTAARRPATAPEGELAASRLALPVALTPLIGRAAEMAAVAALLQEPAVRLVTLTGPGGTGKTRLALAVAEQLAAEFADGVVFVPLAPLGDPAFVASAIAQQLGVRERPGQRLADVLKTHLADRQLLLVLDNFEHLLPAATLIIELCTACHSLRVLVTSRAPVHLSGERTYSVPPLALPDPKQLPLLEDLAQTEAVRLFIDRVQALKPEFALNATTAPAVVEIVHRLDGLPLALELAAARVRVLSPASLLARLDRSLPLLTGGAQDLPARQRTMRDAIAWSYDLLPVAEQNLFRRLAVFTGGFTLEAAAVVGARDDLAVLEGVEALLAASLVQMVEQPDGERHFAMLETVREFGVEQLASWGELEEVGRSHAHYYVDLAQIGGADLAAAAPGRWLAHLGAEQANLRAALTWLRDWEETAGGLRLAGALGGFWRLRNASKEGRSWLETFLAQPGAPDAPTEDRIMALRWAGELAGLEGDLVAAQTRLSESLALARNTVDTRGIAGALGALGSVLFQHGEIAASVEPFTEAVAHSRELGDSRQTAFLLAYLGGAVGITGDLARGEALAAESEELLQSLGDTRSFEVDFLLMIQGILAFARGDYGRAEDRLEAAVALGREIDTKGILSATFAYLAEVALARDRELEAAGHFREGLVVGWEVGFVVGIALNLRGLIWLGVRHGEFSRVARLIGALDAFRGTVRQVPGIVASGHEADVATAHAALGDDAFIAARAAGRALSLDSAVTEAIGLVDETTSDDHGLL